MGGKPRPDASAFFREYATPVTECSECGELLEGFKGERKILFWCEPCDVVFCVERES